MANMLVGRSLRDLNAAVFGRLGTALEHSWRTYDTFTLNSDLALHPDNSVRSKGGSASSMRVAVRQFNRVKSMIMDHAFARTRAEYVYFVRETLQGLIGEAEELIGYLTRFDMQLVGNPRGQEETEKMLRMLLKFHLKSAEAIGNFFGVVMFEPTSDDPERLVVRIPVESSRGVLLYDQDCC